MAFDFDFLVVGHETEGVLAAVAAARAGANTGLVLPLDRALGGLLTEGGLAFVDRDSRHLVPPGDPRDGLFGEFLARAGVLLVALEPTLGETALAAMLTEAGVKIVRGAWADPSHEADRLRELKVGNQGIAARHYLDATPDGDLLEALGEPFATGFREYGIDRVLGISPLPRLRNVSPDTIADTCARLAQDADLQAIQDKIFKDRKFLDFDRGTDYLLIGPPHLALAFQRWRGNTNHPSRLLFEADGFNVAILGPYETSWNGLVYFEEDPKKLLDLSRNGADLLFQEEAGIFQAFLREDLKWTDAEVTLPWGIYVRQTRHALGTVKRLSLTDIATGSPTRSVGTFCYYPDFRGFRVTPTNGPLTARVALDAGLLNNWKNVAIASRAGGYTPPAHSLCRLVQYNVTLGAALGVAAALAKTDLRDVQETEIRQTLENLKILSDDPEGLDTTPMYSANLLQDPLLKKEASLVIVAKSQAGAKPNP